MEANMIISLSPVFGLPEMALSVAGDVLTINGTAFDFSDVLEGATLPSGAVSSDLVVGDVSRINGVLHLTLILPHGANAPDATRFPTPITLAEDGPVTLPLYQTPEAPE